MSWVDDNAIEVARKKREKSAARKLRSVSKMSAPPEKLLIPEITLSPYWPPGQGKVKLEGRNLDLMMGVSRKGDSVPFIGCKANRSPDWWAIIYEDADRKPELFTDESAARKTFNERQVSWSCHLFQRVP